MSVRIWKFLFGLWTLQGLFALFWLWSIPADAENGVVFGYSIARLALFGITLGIISISVILFFCDKLPVFSRDWFIIDHHAMLWDVLYLTLYRTCGLNYRGSSRRPRRRFTSKSCAEDGARSNLHFYSYLYGRELFNSLCCSICFTFVDHCSAFFSGRCSICLLCREAKPSRFLVRGFKPGVDCYYFVE